MSQHESAFENVETREVNRVAALDIGSNSFHLVVARIVADSVQIVHRVKQRVRLADGLDGNNKLSDDAIDRGLKTLQVIAQSLKGFEPDQVRIVATHTLRKATNAHQFIRAAKMYLPYPIEVISGVEEARLIYSGVAHTHHDEGRQLVIDIGGGSTEFVIGEGFNPLLCRSLQMGCVSYSKRYFADGKLTAKAFEDAITSAQRELDIIVTRYRKLGWVRCIGTSGTIKTLYNLAQELHPNETDVPLTLTDLKNLQKRFIECGHIDALTMNALSDERQSVIAGGLAVLIAAFKALKIEQLNFSPAALREGVLYQMEEELGNKDIRGRTASSLATRYDVDTEHANKVLNDALIIYNSFKGTWKLKSKDYQSMLGWAALLHEVGLQINSRGVQKHSAYILANIDMPGFTQEQQLLLSTLVRFFRKKVRYQEIPDFYQYDRHAVMRLIAILRLSVLFNLKRQETALENHRLEAGKNGCVLYLDQQWQESHPVMLADLQQEIEYWKALGLALEIK